MMLASCIIRVKIIVGSKKRVKQSREKVFGEFVHKDAKIELIEVENR